MNKQFLLKMINAIQGRLKLSEENNWGHIDPAFYVFEFYEKKYLMSEKWHTPNDVKHACMAIEHEMLNIRDSGAGLDKLKDLLQQLSVALLKDIELEGEEQ